MRTIKDPDVRRAEILDAAEALFAAKGYAKTTVIHILEAIGIAKGTFYYYFKSKEEVMDAVIDRLVERDLQRAVQVAADDALVPPEKLRRILLEQQPRHGGAKDSMRNLFHQPGNAEMHQRSLVLSISGMAPILERVVREGIETGDFATPYPGETVQMLLVAGQTLFDEGLFQRQTEDPDRRARAFLHNMALLLGARAGSLDFMLDLLA